MTVQRVDMNLMSNVILYSEQGRVRTMKTLWQHQAAIFVFLRHFSCIACRAHVAQVWSHRPLLEESGAQIYFIGNGSQREISKFRSDMDIENAIIYTDPSRRSYQAAGMRRGLFSALGPQSAINMMSLFARGHRQQHYTRAAGDLWQLGGVLIVNEGGGVRYHYVSKAAGDFPGPTQMILGEAAADFSMR